MRALVVLSVTLVLSQPVLAQAQRAPSVTHNLRSPARALALSAVHDAQAQSCFRGQPRPRCERFWISEWGVATRVNPRAYFLGATQGDVLLSLEIGPMRNRSARTALGGTVFVGVGDQVTSSTGLLIGVKPRYRHWFNESVSVDLAPGLFYTAAGDENTGSVGVTGHAAVNITDRVSLTGQLVVAKAPQFLGGETDVGVYVGGKLGSWPGVLSTIATPIAVAVFFLLIPPD